MHSPHRAADVLYGLPGDMPVNAVTAPDAVQRLTFEDIYQRHYRFVWRVLRAFGLPPAAVEDAAQDVFVVVHRRLPTFEGRDNVRAWLFQIARWIVTQHRRQFSAKPAHDAIDDDVC